MRYNNLNIEYFSRNGIHILRLKFSSNILLMRVNTIQKKLLPSGNTLCLANFKIV